MSQKNGGLFSIVSRITFIKIAMEIQIKLLAHVYSAVKLIFSDALHAYSQRCGNSKPTAGLFSPLLSCSPYTLYIV